MSKKQATSLARAAALAALAMAAACTDDGESMRIVQNQIPAEGCTISANASDAFRPRGIIQSDSSVGYVFTPVIQSLLVVATNRPDVQRVVSVRGADIDVTFPDGFFSADEEAELRDDALTRFSSPFSGTLLAGKTLSVSFEILPAELLRRVDALLGPDEAVQASAEIVAFGDTNGGEVESIPFTYPVTICSDCLTIDYGDCATLAESDLPDGPYGNACNTQGYQDGDVPCCTLNGQDVCPADPGA